MYWYFAITNKLSRLNSSLFKVMNKIFRWMGVGVKNLCFFENQPKYYLIDVKEKIVNEKQFEYIIIKTFFRDKILG